MLCKCPRWFCRLRVKTHWCIEMLDEARRRRNKDSSVRVYDIGKSCAWRTLIRQKQRVHATKFSPLPSYFSFCISHLFGHAHSEIFIFHHLRTYVQSSDLSNILDNLQNHGRWGGKCCCAGIIFANPVLDLLVQDKRNECKQNNSVGSHLSVLHIS